MHYDILILAKDKSNDWNQGFGTCLIMRLLKKGNLGLLGKSLYASYFEFLTFSCKNDKTLNFCLRYLTVMRSCMTGSQ